MSQDLNLALNVAFEKYGVSAEDNEAARAIVGLLKLKGPEGLFHWEHSVRVGLLMGQIGEETHMDARAMFLAGLLHDSGKALVSKEVLGRRDRWTPEDQAAIEPHVIDGWKLLRDRFDFTAELVAQHHTFQPHCYPAVTPDPLHAYCHATTAIQGFYGRLLALADTYDAMHRVNSKGVLTSEQIKENMFALNSDMKSLLTHLYKVGVLR